VPKIFESINSVENQPENEMIKIVFSMSNNQFGRPCIEFWIKAHNEQLKTIISAWSKPPACHHFIYDNGISVVFVGKEQVLQSIDSFKTCGFYPIDLNQSLYRYIDKFCISLNANHGDAVPVDVNTSQRSNSSKNSNSISAVEVETITAQSFEFIKSIDRNSRKNIRKIDILYSREQDEDSKIDFWIQSYHNELQSIIKKWSKSPVLLSSKNKEWICIRFTGAFNILSAINNFKSYGQYLKHMNPHLYECLNQVSDAINKSVTKKSLVVGVKPHVIINPLESINLSKSTGVSRFEFCYPFLSSLNATVFQEDLTHHFSDFTATFTHTLIRKNTKKTNAEQAEKEKQSYSIVSFTSQYYLGRGTFSYVYQLLGFTKGTKDKLLSISLYPTLFTGIKQPKAVKIVNIEGDYDLKKVKQEYEFMFAVGYLKPSQLVYEQDKNNKIIFTHQVQNLIEGLELDQYLKKYPDTSINVRLKIAINILTELSKIHEKGIIHRDLKPDNIKINEVTHQIRVIDFLSSIWARDVNEATDIVGSAVYLAPECAYERKSMQSYKLDYYSVAIIILRIFKDHVFFAEDYEYRNDDVAYSKKQEIYSNNAERIIDLPQEYKEELKDQYDIFCKTLKKLAAPRPDDRLSLQDTIIALQAIKLNMENQTASQLLSKLTVFQTTATPLPLQNNQSELKQVSGFTKTGSQ